jgi:hypothetical protein
MKTKYALIRAGELKSRGREGAVNGADYAWTRWTFLGFQPFVAGNNFKGNFVAFVQSFEAWFRRWTCDARKHPDPMLWAMKPNPFLLSNHFILPLAIMNS